MKKIFTRIVIVVLLMIDIVGGIYIIQNMNNPIRDKLNTLDSEKIIECTIEWIVMDENYNKTFYSYTETDTEKIKAVYESIYHMKFREMKEIEYNLPGSMYFYVISLIQDDQTVVSFSYHPSGLVSKKDEYIAQIMNLAEVDKEYGWWGVLDEMITDGEKVQEKQLVEE